MRASTGRIEAKVRRKSHIELPLDSITKRQNFYYM